MSAFLKFLFGDGKGAVNRALDLAAERIEDVDKRNELVARIIESEAKRDTAATLPWADALHKLGRQLIWYVVVGFFIYCKMNNINIDLQELAAVVSGPLVYTMLKGKGK